VQQRLLCCRVSRLTNGKPARRQTACKMLAQFFKLLARSRR
jgi:hypothetical protein